MQNQNNVFVLSAKSKCSNPISLVIVDELGRGTCPVEGAAIAAAALEQLALRGSRTLFATHYRLWYLVGTFVLHLM
jgi:dsDNA-specific endonuclease/ATPase MutS2